MCLCCFFVGRELNCSGMNGKVVSGILGKHAGIYACSGRISCGCGMYSYLEEVTISVYSC